MSYYVIIRGPAAVGKTTIAQQLANVFKGEYLSIDGILDEHKLTKDREQGMISQKSFQRANEIAQPTITRALEHGNVMVIDGNFYWKSQIEHLDDIVGWKHYVFTLKAPLETCVNRDAHRKKGKIGADAIRAVYNAVTKFDYGTVINIENRNTDRVTEEIVGLLMYKKLDKK